MSEYYTLITDLGKKKLADAVAHKTTVELVAFAVGDSNGTDYDPTGAETSLKNEVFRGLINSKDIDPDNPKQIRLE
ncbi:MAG TPA: phage tail protein, partial [Burkholderiales bacterium]|nr:phage tail protein [Burkholderiales bacterium]